MKKTHILQSLWLVILLTTGIIIIRARTERTAIRSEIAVPTPTPVEIASAFEQAPIQVVSITLPPQTDTAPPATLEPSPTPIPTPFSMFWMSDTQYYSYAMPKVFVSMSEWINGQIDAYNAVCTLHTGDIVDNHNLSRHWQNAERALKLLDDRTPLLCVAGNHDVGANTVDYTEYFTYGFCDVTERNRLYYGGVCWAYDLSAGGTDFLIVGVGWQKSDAYVDWVNKTLKENSDRVAILLVHDYLTDDGDLSSNGKKIESSIVEPNKNVRLVLCGHNDGAAIWQKTYEDGERTVTAILYNYQDDKKNGLGYLRILTFVPRSRELSVVTYSPYLDDYSYFSEEDRDLFVIQDAY